MQTIMDQCLPCTNFISLMHIQLSFCPYSPLPNILVYYMQNWLEHEVIYIPVLHTDPTLQMAAAVPTDKEAPMTVATLLDKMLVIVDACQG